MKKNITLCFFILCLGFSKSFAQSLNVNDSLALIQLYDSTHGSDWRENANWKTSQPAANWQGVTVTNGRVTALSFTGNNMHGKIPASFRYLTALTSLYLIDNGLKADLSEFLGDLTSLINIHVGEYNFTDEIPASVSKLRNLMGFTMYSCSNLTQLPVSFKSMNNLVSIDVGYNSITGDITNAIPPNLTMLDVTANRLTFSTIEKLAKQFENNPDRYFFYSDQAKISITNDGDKLLAEAGGTAANNTYKWYKKGAGLTDVIVGDSVYQPHLPGIYYAAVTNSVATELTLVSDEIKVNGVVVNICPVTGTALLTADTAGANYQWQLSTDSISFSAINDSGFYSGTNSASLSISNLPSSMYGTRFRCVTNGVPGTFYTILFSNKWTGSADNNWENYANWNCGNLPDENTSVIIATGSVMINSNVSVKSVKLLPGASLTVGAGYSLTVKCR